MPTKSRRSRSALPALTPGPGTQPGAGGSNADQIQQLAEQPPQEQRSLLEVIQDTIDVYGISPGRTRRGVEGPLGGLGPTLEQDTTGGFGISADYGEIPYAPDQTAFLEVQGPQYTGQPVTTDPRELLTHPLRPFVPPTVLDDSGVGAGSEVKVGSVNLGVDSIDDSDHGQRVNLDLLEVFGGGIASRAPGGLGSVLPGGGFFGELHYGDSDQDGYREFGVSGGPAEVRTEDPIRTLATLTLPPSPLLLDRIDQNLTDLSGTGLLGPGGLLGADRPQLGSEPYNPLGSEPYVEPVHNPSRSNLRDAPSNPARRNGSGHGGATSGVTSVASAGSSGGTVSGASGAVAAAVGASAASAASSTSSAKPTSKVPKNVQ